MRCSACFLECTPKTSVMCDFCSLHYHFQCTTWKIILEDAKFETNGWRCKFCRTGTVKKTLFLDNYSCQDIRIVLDLKLMEKWSVQKGHRKLNNCRRTLTCSNTCSEASIKYAKDTESKEIIPYFVI